MPQRGMHRFVRPRPKKIFFFMPDLGLCPSPEGNTFGQEENQVEMMDIRIPPILTEKGKKIRKQVRLFIFKKSRCLDLIWKVESEFLKNPNLKAKVAIFRSIRKI